MGNEKLYTKTTEISYDNRGFIYARYIPTVEEYDLEETMLQHEFALKLTGGKPYLVLIDTTTATAIPSREAEEYIRSVEFRVAEAFVIDSLAWRIIIRFYMKKYANNPSKIFKDKKRAIEWLLSFKA